MEFDEDEKAIIQVVANHWKLIFKVSNCIHIIFSASGPAENAI